jgi:hypothetical protein
LLETSHKQKFEVIDARGKDATAKDATAKDAIAHIKTIETVEALDAYVAGDDRITVKDTATAMRVHLLDSEGGD